MPPLTVSTGGLTTRRLDRELRVNLIRIISIASFYVVHLWHVVAPRLGPTACALIGLDPAEPVPPNVHLAVTLFCLAWLLSALGVHLLVYRGGVSDRFILGSTLLDVVLLSGILCLSTGPRGPLVAGYFLILLLAGLRFDLRLIRWTTAATVGGYLIVLGSARWPAGILKESGIESVPRYHQIMTVLAILLAGNILEQIVRQAYPMEGPKTDRPVERTK